MLTLSNGTVVQQMVSPTELCTGKKNTFFVQIIYLKVLNISILDHHLDILKRGIAKKFGDGNGLS